MRNAALKQSPIAIAIFLTACTSLHNSESHGSLPPTQWTDQQIKEAVAPMRAGARLSPKSWPNGARVAVCLSFDDIVELSDLNSGKLEPIVLSHAEYGAIEGLPRILQLYDRYDIPGTFYIPAVSALLHPELIQEFKKRPQHEVGIHGWIHERLDVLNNRAEEERLLRRAVDFWTDALGKRPVGYRAPGWTFSPFTLDLIQSAGFEYDSSAMAMDEPYEIMSRDRPTGLVELPVSYVLDDYVYMSAGAMPSPEQVFKVFQDEFDRAYEEGTFFMLTMHPIVTGHRSRIIYLDRLIAHMKSKPGVWFATAQQIADYVKQQAPASGTQSSRAAKRLKASLTR